MVGGSAAVEELLIGMEKSLLNEQMLKIQIIKMGRSLEVKGCQYVIISTSGALSLEGLGK